MAVASASSSRRLTLKAPEAPPKAGHDWFPNSTPQEKFLASTAHEVLFGGAAGGGKSMCAVMDPLRHIHHAHYKCLILRRETPQLEEILGYAARFYPTISPKVRYRDYRGSYLWSFPSGATIRFTHCKNEADAAVFQGREFAEVIFDELTHFLWSQYQEIKSRVRASIPGLPRHVRCTSNPGGTGHDWVFKRWAPWLDPKWVQPAKTLRIVNPADLKSPIDIQVPHLQPRQDETGKARPAMPPNSVAWVVPDEKGKEYLVPKGTPLAISRQFIPSSVLDNKDLMKNDEGYLRRLLDLDPLRREQLLYGDWTARAAPGMLFRREWFKWVEEAPHTAIRVRYWDRAATEPTGQNDPDWTVGTLVAKTPDGNHYVEDIVRVRGTPAFVESVVLATARMDGRKVHVCLEQDPGQSGVFEINRYVKVLAGFSVKSYLATKAKITRAQPASSQVEHGNVYIVRKHWPRGDQDDFIAELEAFPEGGHDDQVDSFSGAVNALSTLAPVNYDPDLDKYLPKTRV